MAAVGEDELLRIRNLYHLGLYQNVINEISSGASQPRNEPFKLEQRTLLYRSYIGQRRYNLVLSELAASTSPEPIPNELKAIYLFAKYSMEVNKSNLTSTTEKQAIIEELKKLAEDDVAASISAVEGSRLWMVELMLSTALYQEGFLIDALKCLFGVKKNLECSALRCQIYLSMHRPDLAQRETNEARRFSEDSLLVQLMEAWIKIYNGGDQYNSAFYIFQELAQANLADASVKLLLGQAICKLHMGELAQAEELLLQALNKDSNHPDVLANLVCCSELLGKGKDIIERYKSQLADISPCHPLLTELSLKNGMFDRAAQRYCASTA